MENQAKGDYDRPNKRTKYSHPDHDEKDNEYEVPEYSNEDLFNPDGTFRELKDDAFLSSIADEEEIATPLADLHSSSTAAYTVGTNLTVTTAIFEDDQDQPLYNFTKKPVESLTSDNTQPIISRTTQVATPVEHVSGVHFWADTYSNDT